MLRNLMLRAAANPVLVRAFSSLGRRSGLSQRFVAGQKVETAIEVVRKLNTGGIVATLDLLGEGVRLAEEARQATQAYIQLLGEISNRNVRSGISIKLTQLGLDVSQELTHENLVKILLRAEAVGIFVRIDMEGSDYTDSTIRIFEQNADRFGALRVGIVIQAYLRRSEEDIRRLVAKGCSIRLCKGAYMEPSEIALQDQQDVERNFLMLMKILLTSSGYTAIASHDHNIIEEACRFINETEITGNRYEFQMLYGVRREYQQQLKDRGYKVRVYVPFGTQWAPYFMRRLAERPANVLFIARAILLDERF